MIKLSDTNIHLCLLLTKFQKLNDKSYQELCITYRVMMQNIMAINLQVSFAKLLVAGLNITKDIKIPTHEINLLAKISTPNKHSSLNGLNSTVAEPEVSLDVEVGSPDT